MDPKHLTKTALAKTAIAVPVTLAVAAGAVKIAADYQDGSIFHPSASDRDIQNNQVLFPDDGTAAGQEQDQKDPDDESSLLEEDKDREDDGVQSQDDADYLFQRDQIAQADDLPPSDRTPTGVSNGTVLPGGVVQSPDGAAPGQIYDIVDRPGDADVILDQGHGDGTGGQLPGGDGDGGGSSSGDDSGSGGDHGGSSSDHPGGSDTPAPRPSGDGGNSGSSGGGSSGGDIGGGGSSGGNTAPSDPSSPSGPTTPDTPATPDVPFVPGTEVSDPDTGKFTPSQSLMYDDLPFTDGVVDPSGDSDPFPYRVTIQKPEFNYNDDSPSILYEGQKEVDAAAIFNALETYVQHGFSRYLWGADALNKFIRIDAISFDGGNTWSRFVDADTVVDIPSGLGTGQMVIQVSYRFSTSAEDWTSKDVLYDPEPTLVYILSQRVSSSNAKIDSNTILNRSSLHPAVGETIHLLSAQSSLLGTDKTSPLTSLFPGWMEEDGTLVPWNYEVTAGRHVLQPAASVPLDSTYTAKMVLFGMTDDFQLNGSNLYYLQTLTGYQPTGRAGRTALTIPEYIQAVQINPSNKIDVDYVEIPDSVLYLDGGNGGLCVHKGYVLSGDDPALCTDDNGILYSKDKTQLLGLPCDRTELTVPATVRQVVIPTDCALDTLHLEAKAVDELPELDYSRLSGCTVLVHSDLLEPFLHKYPDAFADGKNKVLPDDQSGTTYTTQDGAIIANGDTLYRALETGSFGLELSEQIKAIAPRAFEDVSRMTWVSMPLSGHSVTLEKDCFSGSNIKYIICHTKEQAAQIRTQLSGDDAPAVYLSTTGADGSIYLTMGTGEDQRIILMHAPKNIVSFEGTVQDPNGASLSITEIGDNAFQSCSKLQWAVLAQSTKYIAPRAFKGCTALEGVLIDSRDTITIGNDAFDGCTKLRFIASNAPECDLLDGYDPIVTVDDPLSTTDALPYFFFVPAESEGYVTAHTTSPTGFYLDHYDIVKIGETGRMLYGMDELDAPWVALRSSRTVDDAVELPYDTLAIYTYAMADSRSETGPYTLNFMDLSMLSRIDSYAFRHSGLSGNITLGIPSTMDESDYIPFPVPISLSDSAFAQCSYLTGFSTDNLISHFGRNVFAYCTALESVHLGELSYSTGLYPDQFLGCSSLTDLTLAADSTKILFSGVGQDYRFNTDWTPEEETQTLHIHVPEGTENSYLADWRYRFCGYAGDPYTEPYETDYLNMWNAIRWDNLWSISDLEDVDVLLEERLLPSENRIRTMLGMDTVTELSDLYHYREKDTTLTLAGAPRSVTNVTLDAETIGFPEGWYLDYVGTDAFAKSTKLESVTIPGNLVGIYDHAFGTAGTLIFEAPAEGDVTPPKLMPSKTGTPFSFGSDDKDLRIVVPAGSEQTYLNAWVYPMAGYEGYDDMYSAIADSMAGEDGTSPDAANVAAEIRARLTAAENKLRAMMELDLVETTTMLPGDSGTEPPGGSGAGNETEQGSETGETTDSALDTADKGGQDAPSPSGGEETGSGSEEASGGENTGGTDAGSGEEPEGEADPGENEDQSGPDTDTNDGEAATEEGTVE